MIEFLSKIHIVIPVKFKKGLNKQLYFIYIFTVHEDFEPSWEIRHNDF